MNEGFENKIKKIWLENIHQLGIKFGGGTLKKKIHICQLLERKYCFIAFLETFIFIGVFCCLILNLIQIGVKKHSKINPKPF